MYLGKVAELATSDDLYSFPRHPYTGALLSAVPVPDPTGGKRERALLSGDVPSPANPPQACRFHTRCPKAEAKCSTDEPVLEDKGSGSLAACHFPLTPEEVRTRLPAALARQAEARANGAVAGPGVVQPSSASALSDSVESGPTIPGSSPSSSST
jgi:peptide/nickel transport system ATP-binding protein/oligopeptide transport system ATP-binding protein